MGIIYSDLVSNIIIVHKYFICAICEMNDSYCHVIPLLDNEAVGHVLPRYMHCWKMCTYESVYINYTLKYIHICLKVYSAEGRATI